MSGEFGSYCNGYFHTQMEQGADDCLERRNEITRLWGAFLKEFAVVARSISWCEACDSGPDDPIRATIQQKQALQKKLNDVFDYVRTFEDVANAAVREALRKEKNNAKV